MSYEFIASAKPVMMDNGNGSSSEFPFLNLPWELRQRILRLAVAQNGAIELQTPVWPSSRAYNLPIFAVCRSIREEALEAYYKTNTFLWYVDVDDDTRSDPTTYPTGNPTQDDGVFSVLPWRYPYLFQHLRHLYVRIYLSPDPHDTERSSALSDSLESLATALDRGRRLEFLNLFFTYGTRWSSTRVVTEAQKKMLQSLSMMEVSGKVKVTCFDHYLRQSIDALELPRRMKAGA